MAGRITYTGVLTIVLILVVGWLRPSSPVSGVPADTFWVMKYSWHGNCDVVLAGCSRVYRGLSPEEMRKVLPGYRILNFGFSNLGYNEEYLQAVEQLLDPRSKRKTIVLGVQPHNFTESCSRDNGFVSTDEMRPLNRWLLLRFGKGNFFLRPYDIQEVECKLRGSREGYYQHFTKDGWVASYKIPDNPREFVSIIGSGPREHCEPLVKLLLRTVRRWREQGIAVYGVRVPSTEATVKAEDARCDFHEKLFAARFGDAGGVWIPVPVEGYHSYDGSHLRDDSARKLSREIGRAICTCKSGGAVARYEPASNLPPQGSASR